MKLAQLAIEPGQTVTIRAGGDYGPENFITIDEFGGVEVECNGKRVKVDTIDPGPGGIVIFVAGEHEDGAP